MTMVNFGCAVLATVLGVLTLTLVHSAMTLPMKTLRYGRVQSLDDVLFGSNVMFDERVGSKVGCGELCTSTSGCHFFTFFTGNRCRGHSVAETSPAAGTSNVGAKTYIADPWLDEACTTDSDCPTNSHNVQCFSGKCNCVPGYYYSVSTRQCIAACADNDLQSDFLRYPGHRLGSNNLVSNYPAATQSDCGEACVNYYTTNGQVCRSTEFHADNSMCNLAEVTPLDVPDAWEADVRDYSQRKCA